jgi:hypothetical protein
MSTTTGRADVEWSGEERRKEGGEARRRVQIAVVADGGRMTRGAMASEWRVKAGEADPGQGDSRKEGKEPGVA